MEMLKEMICPHCGADLQEVGISIKKELSYFWDKEKGEFIPDLDSYYIDYVRCYECYEGIEEEVFGKAAERLNYQKVLKGEKVV